MAQEFNSNPLISVELPLVYTGVNRRWRLNKHTAAVTLMRLSANEQILEELSLRQAIEKNFESPLLLVYFYYERKYCWEALGILNNIENYLK